MDLVYIEGACFGVAPVELPAAQVRLLLARGDILCNEHNATGQQGGVVFSPSGSVRLTHPGRFHVKRADLAGGRHTVRTAQYLCGITGLLIVNMILVFDSGERLANVKDFLINFSSDILAVGVVLLMSETVDRQRGKAVTILGGGARTYEGEGEGDHDDHSAEEEPNVYDAPMRSVL
jgi:hypothetical protein